MVTGDPARATVLPSSTMGSRRCARTFVPCLVCELIVSSNTKNRLELRGNTTEFGVTPGVANDSPRAGGGGVGTTIARAVCGPAPKAAAAHAAAITSTPLRATLTRL